MTVLKPGAVFNIQPVCDFLLTCLFLQICSCTGAAALQPCLRDTGAAQGSPGYQHAADGPGRARCKGGQSPRVLFSTALLPSIPFTNWSKLLLRMIDERDAASGEEEPKTPGTLPFTADSCGFSGVVFTINLPLIVKAHTTHPKSMVCSTRMQKQQASMSGNGGKALGFQHGLDVAEQNVWTASQISWVSPGNELIPGQSQTLEQWCSHGQQLDQISETAELPPSSVWKLMFLPCFYTKQWCIIQEC